MTNERVKTTRKRKRKCQSRLQSPQKVQGITDWPRIVSVETGKMRGKYVSEKIVKMTRVRTTGRTRLSCTNAGTTPSAFTDGSHSKKAGTGSPFGPGNVTMQKTDQRAVSQTVRYRGEERW